jgi:hypothetical protein
MLLIEDDQEGKKSQAKPDAIDSGRVRLDRESSKLIVEGDPRNIVDVVWTRAG